VNRQPSITAAVGCEHIHHVAIGPQSGATCVSAGDHRPDDILEALCALDGSSPRNPPGGKPMRLRSTERCAAA